ncbi:hypothetical protein C6P45_001257 [Maudiozyma exigua]|uniref:BAH domain-containing protein n=1 Tax=Maudiozyma exigua TaxID=34358 RepID=A0A9P6W3S7_MAUEX|nr:hypothetical protein C6P45_001257 [Kazachstania exigua]
MVIVIRSELEGLLRSFYKDIFELKEENGLEIYPIFNTLPDRKLYIDYYEQITKPISLNTLKKRIPHYTEAQDFLNDVVQMSWNAKTYNTKESDIHKYAKILDKYLIHTMFPKLQKRYPHVRYPYLGPLPDPDDEAGQISLRDKQKEADEKNGIKPEDLVVNKPAEPEKLKEDIIVPVERPRRNMRTMEERKVTIADANDKDKTYTPPDNNMQLRTNRAPSRTSYESDSNSEISSMYSRSVTPLLPARIASNKPRKTPTSIRRGRPPIIELPYLQRVKNVLKNLKRETDHSKNPLAHMYETVPDEMRTGKFKSVIPNPICLEDMRTKLRLRAYPDFVSFQNDFRSMLSNYRVFYGNDHEVNEFAGRIEKLFVSLCKNELSRPDKYFLSDGVMRYPVDFVEVNNIKYEIGDWVLLKNPNDATKPIVAEIFKLWRTEDGQEWLNACWYFRPEQTVHRVDRLFYKNEVVKTGQYRDNVIEDIVAKCYVIHFTRFQRGDPETKVDGTQFVCEYRYNESDKVFNKIRTWKACLPEEIRDIEEPTIPVNGRKFYKYPSPIAQLLDKNATVNSKIPQPVQGDPAGPPLVGAVYMRPALDRDDLGEYSTSPDCPRYIIRPGDPPEEGKLDIATGTILTDSITTTTFTKPYTLSQPRGSGGNSGKYGSSRSHSTNYPQQIVDTFRRPTLPVANTSLIETSQDPLTAKRLADLQVRRFYTRQQMLLKKKEMINQHVSLAKTDQNSSLQMTKIALIPIEIDHPSSYILPISISKNVNVLQRTDYGNYHRVMQSQNQPISNPSKKRFRGESLWFSGPSIDIAERYVNIGEDSSRLYLNRIFKKAKLDFEETTEITDTRNRVLGKHQQQRVISKYSLDQVEPEEQNGNESSTGNGEEVNEEHEFDDEDRILPGTFVISLRPSCKFIAHKLKQKETI